MEINNSSYALWLQTTQTASTSSSATGTESSGFQDMLVTESSYLQEMTSLGVESMGEAPDFSSMTTDEFLLHLIEVQSTLAASGVDISNMTDPSTLTTEELEALQSEMSAKGSKGPPPPPPADEEYEDYFSYFDWSSFLSLNIVDYSSLDMESLMSVL